MKLNRFLLFFLLGAHSALAASVDGYELYYSEREPGVEGYITRMSITGRYLRIDDMSEQESSGFMLFDLQSRQIFSVSHLDKSILVMQDFDYVIPKISDKLVHSDAPLGDAPLVAGRQVHSYRVELKSENIEELCTSVQYVPGLLPEVGKVLHAWQQVVSGNQVKILDRTPQEYRTPCMLSDQVYNRGDYYSKGLVIQEWHSNGRQRLLQDYKKRTFDETLFHLPESYERFTLDDTRSLQ